MPNPLEGASRAHYRRSNRSLCLPVTMDTTSATRISPSLPCSMPSFFTQMILFEASGSGGCCRKNYLARQTPVSFFLRNLPTSNHVGILNNLQTYWKSICSACCLDLKGDIRAECAPNWKALPNEPESGSKTSEDMAVRFHLRVFWRSRLLRRH